jgi:hypothetical protein
MSSFPVVFDVIDKLSVFPEIEEIEKEDDSSSATQMDGEEVRELVKVVDYKALDKYFKNKVDNNQGELKKYLQKLRVHGYDDADFPGKKCMKVVYVKRSGRLFAVGPALARQSKRARAIACGAFADDVDFVGSVPNMFVQVAKDEEMTAMVPTTIAVVKNLAVIRAFLQEYYDVSPDEVKKLIMKCFFSGKPVDDNPLLWAIASELRAFSAELMSKPKYQDLLGQHTDRRNPMASRLACIMFEKENSTSQRLVADLAEKMGANLHVSAFIFDGAIIIRKDYSDPSSELLDICLASFSEMDIAKVAKKPWPEVA